MGWTLNDSASYSAYTSSNSIQIGTVDVNSGDIIVVMAKTPDDTTYPDAITGEDESFTLRTLLAAGAYAHLLVGYVINASANAANTITVGYPNSVAKQKEAVVFVFTPTAGTVSLDDQGWTQEDATYEASPWETDSNSNTGTDTIAVAAIAGTNARTFSNQEIPSGTAADGNLDTDSLTCFYRSLTSTGSIEAETDVSLSDRNSSEMLCFNIAAAGGALSINVSDTFGFSESIGDSMPLGPASVSDTIAISELITALLGITADLNDTFDFAELISASLGINVSVSDTINISEVLTVLKDILPNISDSFSITEVLTLLKDIGILVSDTIDIAESVIASVVGVDEMVVSVADTIGIVETLTILKDLGTWVADTIDFSEVLTVLKDIIPSLSDSFGINESVTLNVAAAVTWTNIIIEGINTMDGKFYQIVGKYRET